MARPEWLSETEYRADLDRLLMEQCAADPALQAAVRKLVEARNPDLVARYRELLRRQEWGE
jgi:hypothetical protein